MFSVDWGDPQTLWLNITNLLLLLATLGLVVIVGSRLVKDLLSKAPSAHTPPASTPSPGERLQAIHRSVPFGRIHSRTAGGSRSARRR
jgi:hypothetical protein